MDFRADGFDLWVFRRTTAGVRYLLLRASQRKADAWFGGSRFWQVPSDFVGQDRVSEAIARELDRFGLRSTAMWAAEHTYTFFNRRYQDIVHIAVFAAEVTSEDVTLDDGHDDHRWVSSEDASELVEFRGLKEGLHWVRHYVTEREPPLAELRLT